MSARRLPRVGDRVEIAYLSVTAAGEVTRLDDEGRRIVVVADDGEEIVFSLNRATGRFHAAGDPAGARMLFKPQ